MLTPTDTYGILSLFVRLLIRTLFFLILGHRGGQSFRRCLVVVSAPDQRARKGQNPIGKFASEQAQGFDYRTCFFITCIVETLRSRLHQAGVLTTRDEYFAL